MGFTVNTTKPLRDWTDADIHRYAASVLPSDLQQQLDSEIKALSQLYKQRHIDRLIAARARDRNS